MNKFAAVANEPFTPELALWILLTFFTILALVALVLLRREEAPRYARRTAEKNEARARAAQQTARDRESAMAAHPAGKGRLKETEGFDFASDTL